MENEKVIQTTPTAEGKQRNFFVSAAKKFTEMCRRAAICITSFILMNMLTAVSAFAAPAGGSGGGGAAGEAQFNAVIEFFATWIGRIGLVVGFIGAIMFALAIKNDDAEAKTRGLMTLASGFVVFAVTQALNMFMI